METESKNEKTNSNEINDINQKIDNLSKIVNGKMPKLLYYIFVMLLMLMIGLIIVLYVTFSSYKIVKLGADFTVKNTEKIFDNLQHAINNLERPIKELNYFVDHSKKAYNTREIEIINSPYKSKPKADLSEEAEKKELDKILSPDIEVKYINNK